MQKFCAYMAFANPAAEEWFSSTSFTKIKYTSCTILRGQFKDTDSSL